MYVYTYMIYVEYHQKVSLPCHSNPNNIKMKHYALSGMHTVLISKYLQDLKHLWGIQLKYWEVMLYSTTADLLLQIMPSILQYLFRWNND